jgi:hypothetical protein
MIFQDDFACRRFDITAVAELKWPVTSLLGSPQGRTQIAIHLARDFAKPVTKKSLGSRPAALCDFGSQGCGFEPCRVQIKF